MMQNRIVDIIEQQPEYTRSTDTQAENTVATRKSGSCANDPRFVACELRSTDKWQIV